MLLLPLLHGRMQVDGCRRGINPWLLAPPAGTLADAVPATLAPLPGIALGLGLGRCLASRAVVLLSHRLGMRILGNGGGSLFKLLKLVCRDAGLGLWRQLLCGQTTGA